MKTYQVTIIEDEQTMDFSIREDDMMFFIDVMLNTSKIIQITEVEE